MSAGYDQFCPVAKTSEILATRWTPLILRELMSGSQSFNDIHRGIPLISRAVLVARLRQLEAQGIIERRPRADGTGSDYWLTPAGEAFGPVIRELRRWGLANTRDRLRPSDLSPALLLWGLRKRTVRDALPDRRVVVRFEFSGVPANRTKYRMMWLLLTRSNVDVCVKDPGYDVDLFVRGNIADFVSVYLGHAMWSDLAGKSLHVEGEPELVRKLPAWVQLDKIPFPDLRPAA